MESSTATSRGAAPRDMRLTASAARARRRGVVLGHRLWLADLFCGFFVGLAASTDLRLEHGTDDDRRLRRDHCPRLELPRLQLWPLQRRTTRLLGFLPGRTAPLRRRSPGPQLARLRRRRDARLRPGGADQPRRRRHAGGSRHDGADRRPQPHAPGHRPAAEDADPRLRPSRRATRLQAAQQRPVRAGPDRHRRRRIPPGRRRRRPAAPRWLRRPAGNPRRRPRPTASSSPSRAPATNSSWRRSAPAATPGSRSTSSPGSSSSSTVPARSTRSAGCR